MNVARFAAGLTEAFEVAAVAVIAAILTAAMTLQYGAGEIPCPLCLIERVALFGAAFGLLMNLRGPYSSRFTGLTLLFSLFLLIVSARQTLLDIYPRPGHAYVGGAVFGLHMPVWSVVIAVALIGAVACRLALLGEESAGRTASAAASRIGRIIGFYVLALCAVNLVSVVVQCGFGQCHTTGYALLEPG